MPGTIQVSVLEFKGLSSASPPSVFLKVALGKKEYQTSDVGDFSFPLTTLRDNLVVALQDAEGNEIAHTDIQTLLIVEKVCWDNIFHLDGGGQVHMKLQFILSEEEQNRIRSMREAAMNKKLGNVPNISPGDSEIASPVNDSVMSSSQTEQTVSDSQTRSVLGVVSLEDLTSQASSLSNYEGSQSKYGTPEGIVFKQEIPVMDERKKVCSIPTVHEIAVHFPQGHESANVKNFQTLSSVPNVHTKPVSSQEASPKLEYLGSEITEKSTLVALRVGDDHVDKSEKQPPLEKTPRNVRKLVSAFESSLAQDVKSPVNLSSVKPEPKKVGKRGRPKDYEPKDVIEPAESSSGRHENPIVTGALKAATKSGESIASYRSLAGNKMFETVNRLGQSTSAPMDSRRKELSPKEWAKSPTDLERPSATKTASIAGRKLEDHSGRVYSFCLSTKQPYSSGSSYAEDSLNKDATEINIQVAATGKSKSLEHREEELFHFAKSRMWVFPNDRKNLCITTAGKRVTNLLGNSHAEGRSHQKKHGTENEKDHKNSCNPGKSRPESSSDNASGGLVAQVLKIAIIVGFGVLVLVTRQREPRKHERETNDLLFTATGYLDEQMLTEREDGLPAES